MKKISEIIRPYVSIILGALLLLFYMNWLSQKGALLAVGIIAVVLAAYYLAAGILGILLGEKMPPVLKKIFDIASISAFPTFLFVYFLLTTIEFAKGIGPAGWAIVITSMVASLALAVTYVLSKLIKNAFVQRLVYLFAGVFMLVLVTNVLFDTAGNPIVLGNINIILVVIYATYTYMLINSFAKGEEKPEEE